MTTLTLEEEDKLAEALSNLSPVDYSRLMGKVDRWQWGLIGPVEYELRPGASSWAQSQSDRFKREKKHRSASRL